jgi:predicted enzyme related to lactoylglutathione lyase
MPRKETTDRQSQWHGFFTKPLSSFKLHFMQTKQAQAPSTESGKTKNLSKLTANTNAVTWFEIPVRDMKRAKEFYETVLDIELIDAKGEKENEEMVLFPRLEEGAMGRSDMVSGNLFKGDRLKPSGEGILIYLNANPSIDKAIARVGEAGGKIVLPKTKNRAGFVSVFIDTEGNKMGIFAGG